MEPKALCTGELWGGGVKNVELQSSIDITSPLVPWLAGRRLPLGARTNVQSGQIPSELLPSRLNESLKDIKPSG